jgi:16S rRNA U516 pseudouridylate synthase RsuA-like enzyme
MDRMAREGPGRGPAGAGRGGRGGGARLVKALGRESIIRVTLQEGRNRQVRRICEAVGVRVVRLKRLSFGPVTVRGLPEGAVRPLERRELEKLRAQTEQEQ